MSTRRLGQVHSPQRVHPARTGAALRAALLAGGILASVLYAAMTIITAMRWPAYDSAAQTVSELSAIGAPTRELWVTMAIGYTLLSIAFGLGILLSAGASRRLRAVGWLMTLYGALGFFWPPMHLRGAAPPSTDTMHIVFSGITVLMMILAMILAAGEFGKRFRAYTFATLAALVAFGTLTSIQAPRVAANLPTPWIGVWERLMLAAFLAWVIALAVALLRTVWKTPEAHAG